MGERAKEKNLISRILVPIDFSDNSAAALHYAVALAKPLKAHLILLHVVDPSYHAGEGLPFTTDRERLLDDFSHEALEEKIPVEVYLVHGNPFGEIIHSAKMKKADLIVLGTHPRSRIDHLFTECVAEKVVEAASCPVVTVRPQPANSKQKMVKTDLE